MKSNYFLCFLLLFLGKTLAQTPPNIIHIIADDVGYDDIGCFGAKDIKTPYLDKLAAEGMKLTQFYAPHGTCTPSRAALMTGKYVARLNNGKGMRVLFPTDTTGLDGKTETTLAQILKKQGYTTGLFGKWHLGHLPKFLPPVHGFDSYLGIPYPNDMGPERRGNTGLWDGLGEFPPIPLIRNDKVIKELDNYDLGELPALFVRESCRFMRACAAQKQPFYLQYANIETHTPWFVPRGFEGRSKAGPYGDAVEYLDLSVGILLDQLKALGLDKNTIVVFTSDNGPITQTTEEIYRAYGKYVQMDTTRKHLLRGGKQQERYEGGIRVSCIVKYPPLVPAGTVSDQLCTSMDWFVTFLKLAGYTHPSEIVLDGKDLSSVLRNEQKTPLRQYIYGFTPAGELVSLRQNNWKLVLPDAKTTSKEPELYDLKSDVGEKKNVALSQPELIKNLLKVADEARLAIKNKTPLRQ